MNNKIHPVKSSACRGLPSAEFDRVKIIFFGTPEFAKVILEKLIAQDNFKICAVVTAPDKPIGRKQILTPPPIKMLAEKNNIPVLQPEKLDEDFINKLKEINSDLYVVASYGKIIPQTVLNIPKHGNINVHPSLLPKYRGASPIQSALLNGDKETGVTIMLMDEKMDHGKIIKNEKLKIKNDEKFNELHDRLAELGAELLVKTIPDYVAGRIKSQEQEHDKATFCKIIKKSDGEINWSKSAEQIYNQWRAFCEWPGVFAQLMINKKRQTVKFTEFVTPTFRSDQSGLKTGVTRSDKEPGEFFLQNRQLFVMCGNNTALEVKKLQPEGKKIMDAQSFINGYLR